MAGKRLFNPRQHNKTSVWKIKVIPVEGKAYVLTFQTSNELGKAIKSLNQLKNKGEIKEYKQF